MNGTPTRAGRAAVRPEGNRPRLVLYGDVNWPLCLLASQRTDALLDEGAQIEWRSVEHRPELPVGGLRGGAEVRRELGRALDDARALLRPGEWLPAGVPAVVPRTQASVSAYAEACGAGVADEVRRVLFAAYWADGLDVGNPEVLRSLLAATFMRSSAVSDPIRQFGYAVSMTRGPITGDAWRLIQQWRRDWLALRDREVPCLVSGSSVVTGAAALGRLARELDRLKLGRPPGLATHRRILDGAPPWRMPTTVRPPQTWATQVGDPWVRTGLMRR